MKITFVEHAECFGIELEPESVKEAVQLTRFAMNATKEVRSVGAYARRDLTMDAHLVIGKRKQDTGEIKP